MGLLNKGYRNRGSQVFTAAVQMLCKSYIADSRDGQVGREQKEQQHHLCCKEPSKEADGGPLALQV